MSELTQRIEQIVGDCSALPEAEQAEAAGKAFSALEAECTLNPTGDDPAEIAANPELDAINVDGAPAAIQSALQDFLLHYRLINTARQALSPEAREDLSNEIRQLAGTGFLHAGLVEKFWIPENRLFLDKALHNAESVWQMAMVANWALNGEGLGKFSQTAWATHCRDTDLLTLIEEVEKKLRLGHIPTLRDYRRQGMHHYPRITDDEFSKLKSEEWREVIDLPSGRRPEQDIPFITPFIKQGDIEHSLYRHILMPDLYGYMRERIPASSGNLDLNGKDRDILLSLPLVVQQIQDELFNHVKNGFAGLIRDWARDRVSEGQTEVADALAIAGKIWNYRRTPAAQECTNPVENLIKGFNATIRNAFGHFTDINFAATYGNRIDPMDVSEKFVLFASVSNGQLDNLATAHARYLQLTPNPADWDNQKLFECFLEVNRSTDLHHIQAHFLVDKTRGCPAIPQIARFHELVLDLVLDYVLKQFGEENLRNAGNWFLQQKTPGPFA